MQIVYVDNEIRNGRNSIGCGGDAEFTICGLLILLTNHIQY